VEVGVESRSCPGGAEELYSQAAALRAFLRPCGATKNRRVGLRRITRGLRPRSLRGRCRDDDNSRDVVRLLQKASVSMAHDCACPWLQETLRRQWPCLARPVQGIPDRTGRAPVDGATMCGKQPCACAIGGAGGGLALVEFSAMAIAAARSGPNAAAPGLAGICRHATYRRGAGSLAPLSDPWRTL
jgi:hypothetical protein